MDAKEIALRFHSDLVLAIPCALSHTYSLYS